MRRIIHAVVWPDDESGYIGEVAELHVITQGDSLDEVAANLREAVGLALEGEDLATLGLEADALLSMTIETDLVIASA